MVGNVYILDVRPEFQYKEGCIKGSYNIPIYQISKRYNEIPMNKKVVVVDGHGNPAWIPACWFLKIKGYDNLSWLQGGVDAWEKGGFPIEK
jgi:rhodanese-related sulfurtransferase